MFLAADTSGGNHRSFALLNCRRRDARRARPQKLLCREIAMTDTAIVGENVEIIQTRGPRSAFSWSVVIAGALAAWAVAFIVISLGAGIGLAISTPYSGPGTASMTIAGAVWLVLA